MTFDVDRWRELNKRRAAVSANLESLARKWTKNARSDVLRANVARLLDELDDLDARLAALRPERVGLTDPEAPA